jgi:hypothetical protein
VNGRHARTRSAAVRAALFATWLIAAASAGAITFQPKTFDELVAQAEQIFVGTTGDASSRRTDRGLIVTDFTFVDIEVLKGAASGRTVTLMLLGGTVGAESLEVQGAPSFRIGARYIVFVSGNDTTIYPIVGGAQGIFQVRVPAGGGNATVYTYGGRPVTEIPGAPAAAAKRATPADASGPGAAAPLSKDAFVEAVRSRLPR